MLFNAQTSAILIREMQAGSRGATVTHTHSYIHLWMLPLNAR
jgi:hypothetical protein